MLYLIQMWIVLTCLQDLNLIFDLIPVHFYPAVFQLWFQEIQSGVIMIQWLAHFLLLLKPILLSLVVRIIQFRFIIPICIYVIFCIFIAVYAQILNCVLVPLGQIVVVVWKGVQQLSWQRPRDLFRRVPSYVQVYVVLSWHLKLKFLLEL
jgi:hypothetical protein